MKTITTIIIILSLVAISTTSIAQIINNPDPVSTSTIELSTEDYDRIKALELDDIEPINLTCNTICKFTIDAPGLRVPYNAQIPYLKDRDTGEKYTQAELNIMVDEKIKQFLVHRSEVQERKEQPTTIEITNKEITIEANKEAPKL